MPPESCALPPATLGAHARRGRIHRAIALFYLCIALLAAALAGAHEGSPRHEPEDLPPRGDPPPERPVRRGQVLFYTNHLLLIDPNPFVVMKEFALFHNVVPAPQLGPGRKRDLFHILYQRSGASQASERTFGHAWSGDLRRWTVDTLAFAVDTTAWNALHVWSPSLVHFAGRDYLFYTGVDANRDQSIGYTSAPLLDTTNTLWDLERTQAFEASDTRWAVPDPPTFSGQTQFRDAYVMNDPEHADRLLMFYAAHDSVDLGVGRAALAVGVARSESGAPDRWQDLGYFRKTLSRTTGFWQLEGPHVMRAPDPPHRWWLLYTSAGAPAGETGNTTIRFQQLAPGHSVADTSADAWSPQQALMTYLQGEAAVFGWSGSEHLRVGRTDVLAGFTAWGPIYQGIALTKMNWQGENFSLSMPSVLSVDEHRSPTRDVHLAIERERTGARRVQLVVDSPVPLVAKLEIFDVAGRRVATLHDGPLAVGRAAWSWPSAGVRDVAPDGVYFVRLAYPGGARTASFALAH